MPKYITQRDEEDIIIEKHGQYYYKKNMCCDCGLIYDIRYKVKKNKLIINARRNRRSTGQARRWINANRTSIKSEK